MFRTLFANQERKQTQNLDKCQWDNVNSEHTITPNCNFPHTFKKTGKRLSKDLPLQISLQIE